MTTAPALPTGEEKRRVVRQMFDAIAGRYQMVNTIMSFGLDRSWRRRCTGALELPPASTVLDVACGTGDLCRQLLREGYRAVGVDLSPGMLRAGNLGAERAGTAPVVLGDALHAPFTDASFDGAVSGFALRNVVDLGELFTELGRLVRPGGRVSLLDLGQPDNAVLRLGHQLWSGRAVPVVGALLSDGPSYRYLPRSLAYLPGPDVITGLLEAAGFQAVQHELLSAGVAQLFVATRRRGRQGDSQ